MPVYYQLTPFVPQFVGSSGAPLSNGTLNIYLAGTTTPSTLYTDDVGTATGAVITLNTRGYPSISGNTVLLYALTGVEYKIILKDRTGAIIYTLDSVSAESGMLAALAAPTGTDLVGYGLRVLTDKLQEVVSVKDPNFAAIGNGIANDSPAILAAAMANPGKIILLPEGTYKLLTTILQDTTGLGDITVCKFVGSGMSQTIIDNQTGGAAFKVTSGNAAEFAYNFAVGNLTIKSTGSQAGTMGIELLGCRFVDFAHLRITEMASHGIYGASSVGDLTDTAQLRATQCLIDNNGGYGVYAKTDGNAIQYAWNLNDCRIGLNALGGILGESLVNSEFKHCGVYYNGGFGIRIKTGSSGAPAPKLVSIDHCELDTNEGVQINLATGHGHTITAPYLVDNNLTPAFTKGIEIGACQSVVINQASPRMNPAVTGKVVVEVGAASVDIVIRDSNYQGWSALNGTFYVDNTSDGVTIDDRNNRLVQYNGSYTAEVKNSGSTATSPTTVTAYYEVSGNMVLVGLRNLNNIDTSVFAGADILVVTLPFKCKNSSVGFAGSCIITSDGGTGIPIPITEAFAQVLAFLRSGSGAYLTAANLTTGVSDIRVLSLGYIKD
jgi:hypothetical protein